MKYVIVYWSRFGNGKKLVEHLAGTLNKRGADIQMYTTEQANPAALPNADLYVFSAPAEGFTLQKNMKQFMKALEGMEGKKYGVINTHGMKRHWLSKMEKLLSKKSMEKIAAVDFQIADGSQTGAGLMDGWEEKLNEFAGKIEKFEKTG